MEHTLNVMMLDFSMRLAAAGTLLILGGWGIRIATRLCDDILRAHLPHNGLTGLAVRVLRVMLWSALVVSMLGLFGVPAASLLVLLGATGWAIGLASKGILANLAAGVFLVTKRPFAAGDWVKIANITGVVVDLGLLITRVNRSDNVCVSIGNQHILAHAIVNYSINPFRRVDLHVRMPHGIRATDLMLGISACVRSVANVAPTPAPQIALLELDTSGMLFTVRPFCHHQDYSQVRSDVLAAIQTLVFATAGVESSRPDSFTPARHSPNPATREVAATDSHTDRSV